MRLASLFRCRKSLRLLFQRCQHRRGLAPDLLGVLHPQHVQVGDTRGIAGQHRGIVSTVAIEYVPGWVRVGGLAGRILRARRLQRGDDLLLLGAQAGMKNPAVSSRELANGSASTCAAGEDDTAS